MLPSDIKVTSISEPTKLCCNVKGLIICHVCQDRWCVDCWTKGSGHYSPLYKYRCYLNVKIVLALLGSDGTEWMANSNCPGPYQLVAFDETRHKYKATRVEDPLPDN